MIHRYKELPIQWFSKFKFRPFAALREKFNEGYTTKDLRADFMSGLVVAAVAIPLGMALAIASGVPPQHGLYTVIVGGGTVALLGGSRFQVTGPTAAFVVILAPIVSKYGLKGLMVAGFLAGLMLILMGLARLGRLIQFIPYPVTTGFTSGIAVVIAVLQLKDFFGLHTPVMPERFLEKAWVLISARNTASLAEFGVALVTLSILLIWPKVNKKIPAPLIALTTVTIGTVLLKKIIPGFDVATIASRFANGIPQQLPHLEGFGLVLEFIETMVPAAFAIAMLGAIESLLSAVVADGMAQTKHDPDAELVALGVGNVLCPLFGGIPATGAIARTATNIRFGAKSPLSAIFHALFTLLAILLFAPYVSYLPMASLAALLILVAYNMSELKHFMHILKVGPRGDAVVLLICFGLTVTFDMVVGVMVGVGMAAALFMKQMASATSSRVFTEQTHPRFGAKLPHKVVLYEIAGPLFFGAAENAVEAMSGITDDSEAVIFLLESVPVMDVTGLVAFESAIEELLEKKKRILVVAARKQPRELMARSQFFKKHKGILFFNSVDQAVLAYQEHSQGQPSAPAMA